MGSDARVGILSLVLVLPAVLLVTTSLVGTEAGLPAVLVHPLTVMGGLALALVLSAVRVFRVHIAHEPGAVVGTVALRLRGTGLPLSTFALSLLLLGIIAVYLFLENFQPRLIG